jgi:cytochrome d ubiquinol oxidase subunit I
LFLAWRRRRLPDDKWMLRAIVACGPLGFLAIEAGWTVTEVGRQPWIIYNVLRTADAVTPVPGVAVTFLIFTLLYFVLAVLVVWMLWRQVSESPRIAAPTPPSQEAGHAAA